MKRRGFFGTILGIGATVPTGLAGKLIEDIKISKLQKVQNKISSMIKEIWDFQKKTERAIFYGTTDHSKHAIKFSGLSHYFNNTKAGRKEKHINLREEK